MTRTSVKPPLYGRTRSLWSDEDLVQVERISKRGQEAEYVVFVNEEQVGTVACSTGRATVRIKGTRQSRFGGIEKRWRYRLSGSSLLPSAAWARTRAEAIEDLICDLRTKEG